MACDRLVHLFQNEQGDQSGLCPEGAARRQHGCAVVSQTSGHDNQVTKGAFVAVHRPRRRETVEILRQGPQHVGFVRATDKTDVRSDFEPADKRPGARLKQSFLRRAEREGDRGADGRPFGFPGVGVQTGGHVDRQDRDSRAIDLFDQFHPGPFQRPVQADAEQSIDDQSRRQREERVELFQGAFRVREVQQTDFAVRKVLSGLARVIAIVALAGQDQNQVARTSELFGARGDNVSDAADDLRRRALCRPGEPLPFAHLGDADHRDWHRLI